MAKSKTSFFCQNCGSSFAKWQGQCNSCKSWNTIVEEVISTIAGGWEQNSGTSAEWLNKAIEKQQHLRNHSRLRAGSGWRRLRRCSHFGRAPVKYAHASVVCAGRINLYVWAKKTAIKMRQIDQKSSQCLILTKPRPKIFCITPWTKPRGLDDSSKP